MSGWAAINDNELPDFSTRSEGPAVWAVLAPPWQFDDTGAGYPTELVNYSEQERAP